MGGRAVTAVILSVLLIGSTFGAAAANDQTGNAKRANCNDGNNGNVIGAVIGATVGAGLALFGLPVAIGALGFTGAGIAAGSIASQMMSAAAVANGGGVAAGSTVAVLQSIGAAGFSLGTKLGLTAALGSAGAASGACVSESKETSK